jgi:hypothetical protein
MFWRQKPSITAESVAPKTEPPRDESPELFASDDLMTRAENIAWLFSRARGGRSYSSYLYDPAGAALDIYRVLQTYERLDAEAEIREAPAGPG